MTDKEVQKLSRKELLEFLLDAQTENEALRKDRSELRRQLKTREEELAKAREDLSQANEDLSRAKEDLAHAKEDSSDAGAQAADRVAEDGFADEVFAVQTVHHRGVRAQVAAPAHAQRCEHGDVAGADQAA